MGVTTEGSWYSLGEERLKKRKIMDHGGDYGLTIVVTSLGFSMVLV